MKNFSDLNEQELLALAISLEEEDGRTYGDLALARLRAVCRRQLKPPSKPRSPQ
jgi:hypothetical protein